MEIEIEIYRMPNGYCPFDDWIEDVKDVKTKVKILTRLDRLKLGNFGDYKNLGDGVSEL
jgi:putative addiction module killer protein